MPCDTTERLRNAGQPFGGWAETMLDAVDEDLDTVTTATVDLSDSAKACKQKIVARRSKNRGATPHATVTWRMGVMERGDGAAGHGERSLPWQLPKFRLRCICIATNLTGTVCYNTAPARLSCSSSHDPQLQGGARIRSPHHISSPTSTSSPLHLRLLISLAPSF